MFDVVIGDCCCIGGLCDLWICCGVGCVMKLLVREFDVVVIGVGGVGMCVVL